MGTPQSFLFQAIQSWLSRCLSVRLFVCPCVRTLSTPSFFVQFNQQGYCQKLHAKEKVLRSFPAIIIKKLKEKFNDSIFWKSYLYYENSSGSVRLFVCPYVRTSSTFLDLIRLAQKRYLWIPYKKGAGSLRLLACFARPAPEVLTDSFGYLEFFMVYDSIFLKQLYSIIYIHLGNIFSLRQCALLPNEYGRMFMSTILRYFLG